jgi:hypothetical protein
MELTFAFFVGVASSIVGTFLNKRIISITVKGKIKSPINGDYAEMYCRFSGNAKKNIR